MNFKDIEQLKRKNESVFNKFYDKYNKLFFSIIYKIVKDFTTTEDLLQDAFCKILECLDQYRGGNFKYWCISICKNIANMHLRKLINERNKYNQWVESQTHESTENVNIDYYDIQQQLLRDIKLLVDNNTYEIIILHLVQKLKFREIAEIRNETTSSVLGKYHRGIKLIRSKIDHEKYR